jgi:L-cysteine:1D-myo-inositol 2-amino-2-deoxy-alpha-D-glucopyranoside ligase
LKLYNTLSKRLETFEPQGDEATLYVCGITPYDTTHLGHAFTYSVFDVLTRYLELRELKVKYVQNVTDIDDDILRRAVAVQQDWRTLGNEWTVHFIDDMQSLNILPPDRFPRATEVIDDIISDVKKLLKSGYAYEARGSVYFSVDSWRGFGKLSHLPHEEMLPIANQRGNHPEDPNKKNPLDFVLWQAQKPGEPAWESPWGPGRPGWHIECSTMATKYLGKVVDIHGGGGDLCFPHHECEIAQVESHRDDDPFVRYWMHTAMVEYKGEKMSKSLGNLVMIRDLLQTFSADGLRLYLASHHYREPWAYDESDLEKAEKGASRIRDLLVLPWGDGPQLNPASTWAAFTAALDNDLDTPQAVAVLNSFVEETHEAALAQRNITNAQQAVRDMAQVFGLRLNQPEPDERVKKGWSSHLSRFQ